MNYLPTFKATLLAASLVGLTACGGSDDAEEQVLPGNDEITTNEDAADVDDDIDEGTAGDEDDVNGELEDGADDTAGLNDPVPRYPILACGDLPVSDVSYSNSVDAPATMTPGMIVGGRVDPESSGNTEHFWTVDLQAGFYHLVVDRERLDKDTRRPGLELTDLNGAGEGVSMVLHEQETAIYGTGISHTRGLEFLEISEPRTLQIRVASDEDAEDYTFALFENGSAVPSPFFEDCPSIQSLSLGTTETTTLSQGEVWYRIDLEEQDYLLDLTATRADGRSSIMQADVVSLDLFGQLERYDEFGSFNENDFSATTSYPLRRSEAGPVWIQLRNSRSSDDLNIEFTLQSDE